MYQARQATYDLKKLSGKNLIEKVGKSRRYQVSETGLRTMSALLILRDKVFKPGLSHRSTQGRRPLKTDTPVEVHYTI